MALFVSVNCCHGGYVDKPFKSIEEQVEILEGRGLRTNEATPLILERENYYSVINGYKDPFLEMPTNGVDRYLQGTAFDDVYRLFCFDRDLRMFMFRYFAIAESTLKSTCAYQFSKVHRDEIEPYLNPANYRAEPNYKGRVTKFVGELSKIVGRDPDCDSNKKPIYQCEYMRHYAEHHDGIPLWVLTNYLMFGQIFKFFDFQTESMRDAIARSYSNLYAETHQKPQKIFWPRLRRSYNHIKDFRNICAHDERLYCSRVAPAKDIKFVDVTRDLQLVLRKDEDIAMIEGLKRMVVKLGDDLPEVPYARVLKSMGFTDMSLLKAPK